MKLFVWFIWLLLYLFSNSAFSGACDKNLKNRNVMALLWLAMTALQVWSIGLLIRLG